MHIIGLMSGTSLDGLDVALVDITGSYKNIQYQLIVAETIPYSKEWKERLSALDTTSAYEYALANVQLGHYFGKCVNSFISKHNFKADIIASHGHTVFHQPDLLLTTQIADGDAIAAETHLPVVSNFRTLDVALGGQGAPLVPIGDRLLFGQYDACLNLGGIANISFEKSGERIAYDICPCNMALNLLAQKINLEYDKDGMNAKKGSINDSLFNQLNSLDYYKQNGPKSLGKEWFLEYFQPLIDGSLPTEDYLRTCVDHIATQIAIVIKENNIKSILITGGGALNKFLIGRLEQMVQSKCKIVIPDSQLISYKEAIVFALLGYLRLTKQTNTLASVTGTKVDSIGGTISGLY